MRKTLTIVTLVSLLALAGSAVAGDAPNFFSQVSSGGSFLGVHLSNLDDDRAAELGVRDGVLIDRVIEDSAASEAGLEDGDVVLSFDGERVRSAAHLGRLVRETAPGRSVELVVQRDGRERDIVAKLREGAPSGALFAPRAPMPAMPALPELPAFAPLAQDAYRQALRFAGGPNWRLGIQADDLGGQLAEFFEVEQGDGVLVEGVLEGSAAEKAGLRSGDVIVGLDDERIHSLAQLREFLADDERDAAASLVIVRKGRERSLPVELEKIEQRGALWFGGDNEAMSELRERYAEQAEAWAEQAEQWRGQQHQLRRELEEHARELREETRERQREMREEQRQLQRQLRETQREMRKAAPAPTAAPAPLRRSMPPGGLHL